MAKIGQKFTDAKKGWATFQIDMYRSGSDANYALSELMLMLGNIVKLSGDVGNVNEQEQARTLRATAGNWTSNSEQAGDRIKAAVKLHKGLILKLLQNAKKVSEQGGDSLIAQLKDEIGEGEGGTSTTVSPKRPGESVPDYLKRTRK